MRHFTALDGLRAVSVLLVVLAHARGREDWLWIRGANGVTVFFVLSGYLDHDARLARGSGARTDRPRRASTCAGRSAFCRCTTSRSRSTACSCSSCMPIPRDTTSSCTRCRTISRICRSGRTSSSKDVPFELSWSLGIEEKFYLVWPVLGFILLRKRFRLRLGTAARPRGGLHRRGVLHLVGQVRAVLRAHPDRVRAGRAARQPGGIRAAARPRAPGTRPS